MSRLLALLQLGLLLCCLPGRAAPVNFLKDGGFEQAAIGESTWHIWAGGGDASHISYQSSHTGQYSLALIRRRKEDWTGANSTSWPVKGIKRWFVAAWVKTRDCQADKDFIYLRFWGPKGFLGQQGPALPTHTDGWQFISAFVATPEGATSVDCSPQVFSPAPATAWVDDCFVCPASEVAGLEPAQLKQLVANTAERAVEFRFGTEAAKRLQVKAAHVSATSEGLQMGASGRLELAIAHSYLAQGAFTLTASRLPSVQVLQGASWRTLQPASQRADKGKITGAYQVDLRPGEQVLHLKLTASAPLVLYSLGFFAGGLDLDQDGLSDHLERFLGENLPAERGPFAARYSPPRTSFQNPTGYLPKYDLKIDCAIVSGNSPEWIKSWQAKGYHAYVMYGFRDGPEWVKAHPGEPQTTADGVQLTCGPGSYYLVPTQARVEHALEYFKRALEGGTEAVCPEEPEFFARAGYSPAFKQAFQEAYGRPWQPATSPEEYWLQQKLKGDMEVHILSEIYRQAERFNPKVKHFLLVHSPINYTASGIVFPHYQMLKTGLVDEMIDQTWSDMLRGATTYAGISKPRPDELGYLEYSSAVGLGQGLVKLWFLQDPLGDAAGLPIEVYRNYYEANVVAALLRPEVTRYEVMPWPVRIFGHIPDWYATEITSVVQALGEQSDFAGDYEWLCPHGKVAVAFGGSAPYQRGGPFSSNMDSFWGLAFGLLFAGYAPDVACLDRLAEPGYLDQWKVLFLSYDGQKPLSPAVNERLAEWVKAGGTLVFFGAGDDFDAVEGPWRKAGFASPQDRLMSLLGIDVAGAHTLGTLSKQSAPAYEVVAATDYKGREGANRKWVTINFSPALQQTGKAFVKFEDTLPEDGWGPAVFEVRLLDPTRGNRILCDFKPGTPEETQYLALDHGSSFNGVLRFADAHNWWVYEFDLPGTSKALLQLDIQGQYRISLAAKEPRAFHRTLAALPGTWCEKAVPRLVLKSVQGVKGYPAGRAERLYALPEKPGACYAFSKSAGKGKLYYFGFDPAACARSTTGAELVKALLQQVLQPFGEHLPASNFGLCLKRGPYLVCKQETGERTFKGNFINLFDPDLSLVHEVTVKAGERCLLREVSKRLAQPEPAVLWTSSKLNWWRFADAELKILVSGPADCPGKLRFTTKGRTRLSVQAVGSDGKHKPCKLQVEGASALVSYTNEPPGLALKIKFD